MMMVFAVKEINENVEFLSNTTLGYEMYITCPSLPIVIENTIHLLKNHMYTGNPGSCTARVMIGPFYSETAKFLSPFMDVFYIPQVKHLTC